MLPPVTAAGPVDETAVLPPVRPTGQARPHSAVRPTAPHSQEAPADRVPPGIFRDSGGDVTRELPVVDDDGRPRRPRPSWAEETPLDDLPSLADELLGPHRDDEDGEEGPRRRR